MNYQKLDAALAIALKEVQNSETPTLTVFIHTEPTLDSTATTVLENLGVRDLNSGKDTFTATLSANAISQLSAESWVKHLNLSQKLRFMNREKKNF